MNILRIQARTLAFTAAVAAAVLIGFVLGVCEAILGWPRNTRS